MTKIKPEEMPAWDQASCAALGGILACPDGAGTIEQLAVVAGKYADAIIEERRKRTVPEDKVTPYPFNDTDRLRFLMTHGGIDGFKSVKLDRHQYAQDIANENEREEPTEEDQLDGFRWLLDTAMIRADEKHAMHREPVLPFKQQRKQ